MTEKIAVIGLGYVGLPVALAFARKFPGTVGFDIDATKVSELRRGYDRNHEVPEEVLTSTSLAMTSSTSDLAGVTFFVVAVPTPVDEHNVPDLTPVVRASETVGKVLAKDAVVVYESTVYPGVTEEICGPVLAKVSGLTQGVDFKLGYSPERINPGDKEHTLERITKVVSGEDAGTLERVASAYGAVVDAGVHRAPSIKVAEAAKVIENTQRDINIALMNELAIIFDRMGIRTSDVLAAAGTKWNFLKFRPGLVGGHCIGVDPYYLTTKAQQLGYQPEVILAGRRINDNMGRYVAGRLVKLLVNADIPVRGARVGVLGLTFKEDVNDIRNSKVPDILRELREFGIQALIHDPLANAKETAHEYGLSLASLDELQSLDALVFAVAHDAYLSMGEPAIAARVRDGGVLVDVKSALRPEAIGDRIRYWSL
ncbi:UDP-glucose dehydrogenase [Labilithrix luteola]|uniref:UDP-glucose dehydrogenase n=1 Tax=Labilithrix luteola TaxID=1391654 RepID=A0A0K1Q8W1_9BACT|nr:nucleotide sugar dehydrogenase [Labilithrix luteola]AKV01850.1 UDP-glucose dehydrogenase [Labilithrix luteola]